MLNHRLREQVNIFIPNINSLPKEVKDLLKVISQSYDQHEGHSDTDTNSSHMAIGNHTGVMNHESHSLNSLPEIDHILNTLEEVIFSMEMTTCQYKYVSSACERI